MTPTIGDSRPWRATRWPSPLNTPASGLDPYLELRDANDSTVASENNGGPDSDDYLSYYSIPADGTYYVRVGDYYYNTTPGSYEVRVELARGIQLESDRNYNNNSFSNADVLTLQQGEPDTCWPPWPGR